MNLETGKKRLKIPLTHMADIAYLLLIFIIIFSLISSRYDVPVPLPVSEAAAEAENGEGYVLTITAGNYMFDDFSFEQPRDLAGLLENTSVSAGMRIVAGKEVPFGRVKSVYKILREWGFNRIDFLVSGK